MTDLERQLREDRNLRDGAKALLIADYESVRADLQHRSVGSRVMDRVGEGASELFDEAKELADNNPGVFAALVAALFVWIAGNPFSLFFSDDEPEDDEEPEE